MKRKQWQKLTFICRPNERITFFLYYNYLCITGTPNFRQILVKKFSCMTHIDLDFVGPKFIICLTFYWFIQNENKNVYSLNYEAPNIHSI